MTMRPKATGRTTKGKGTKAKKIECDCCGSWTHEKMNCPFAVCHRIAGGLGKGGEFAGAGVLPQTARSFAVHCVWGWFVPWSFSANHAFHQDQRIHMHSCYITGPVNATDVY